MDYTTRILSLVQDKESSNNHPILVDAERPDRCISRRDYVTLVKRIAVGLARHGIADQDGVGLLSENDIYYYVLGDGVVAAGGVYTGVPTFVKQAELATAIRAAGLKWLFVAPEFLDMALSTVQSMGLPSSMILVFDPPGGEPYDAAGRLPLASLSAIMDGADESAFRNANEGKDPATREAFRLFTSGTTGPVKAAVISHRASVVRVDVVTSMSMLDGRFLLIVGMFHSSGGLRHMRACLSDSSTFISRAKDAAAIIDRIHSLDIGVTMLTPPLLEAMTSMLGSAPDMTRRVASLRHVFFTGIFCHPEVVDAARKAFSNARLVVGYGATETPAICGVEILDDWVPGYVGKPLSLTTIKIVDPDSLQEVPPGVAGEICARSEDSFSGYYDSPEANANAFLPSDDDEPKTWFRTGDKGVVDPETGGLTLLGRFKEIFKVHCKEVAPVEVEGVLLEHDDIADVRVMSTPARHYCKDNECLAYVVRRAGGGLTAQEVVDFVATRLAPHKAPTGGVLFCNEIPRGAMGKPLKTELDKVVPLPGSARYLTRPA